MWISMLTFFSFFCPIICKNLPDISTPASNHRAHLRRPSYMTLPLIGLPISYSILQMCKQLTSLYSGCGHREPYGPGGLARCDPVYFNRGKCKGLQKADSTEDSGDCNRCRRKEIIKADARIKEGRARLAEWSKENGYDYVEELRARMRAEGYDY